MFQIDYEKDCTYDVRFCSHWNRKNGHSITRHTECSISLVDTAKVGKDRFTVVSTGVVSRYAKDRDIKKEGQAQAFLRAIDNVPQAHRGKMWAEMRKRKILK